MDEREAGKPRWGGEGRQLSIEPRTARGRTHKYCGRGQRSQHSSTIDAHEQAGLTWLPSTTWVLADSARTVPLSEAVTILLDVEEVRLKRRESDVVAIGRRVGV